MREALLALAIAAPVLAWAVALRRPAHRPIAWALSACCIAELAHSALMTWVLPAPNMDRATPPLQGALRWAIHAERATYLVSPAAFAALALRVLALRPAWPAVLGYTVSVLALALTYPWSRFDVLRKALLAAELAAVAVEVASAVSWHRRTWRRERADISATVALVIVAMHLSAVLAGAYRVGLFGEAWALSQLVYFGGFTTVILLQLGALAWPQTSD
ncbi:hypothetical protein WME94_25230 [Sorangium sp. So ce429]